MHEGIIAMSPEPSSLTDAEFLRVAHGVLARIESVVDAWLQDDVIDIDSARTGGLLELSFPGGSKIVVNTQPPLHEIWLAARSGGHHFRYTQGAWRSTRDDREFFDVLSKCASEHARRSLVITPG